MLHIVERFRSGSSTTIVYIVPTRALINQVADDVLAAFRRSGVADVTVTTIPVNLAPAEGEKPKVFYVLTQERLEALLVTNPTLQLDLVVVDEAQIISEGTRGVLLESVIDRVTAHSTKTQFVFSGPMIANPQFFGEIFGLNGFAPCATVRSPVTQNIIFLEYQSKPQSEVAVRLADRGSSEVAATVPLPFRLHSAADRLSYLSYLFGRGEAAWCTSTARLTPRRPPPK